MTEEQKQEVNNEANVEATDSSTENSTENAASENEVKNNEVNVDSQTDNSGGDKNVEKFQSHIDNLNTALKQERESGKANKAKIDALEQRLETANKTLEKFNKLEQVFNPQNEKEVEEVKPQGMTEEQMEKWYEAKEKEREEKTQAEERKALIDKEVKEMEEKWDGSNGKPKYDDSDMIQWQRDNNKMYLTPKEAFLARFNNDIIDWEAKKRLEKKPDVQNVEQPGGGVAEERNPRELNLMTEANQRATIMDVVSRELDSSDSI